MKNYRIQLDTGEYFELLGVDFDAENFVGLLNDQKTVFVNLSGYIVHKHSIRKMIPFIIEE